MTPQDSLRYGARYTLAATSSIRDLRGREGEPLDQNPATPEPDEFLSSFRTKAEPREPVGPWVVSTSPADNEANAPVFRPVSLLFSRPIQTASVAGNHLSVREKPGDVVIPSQITWNAERTRFTVTPTYNGGLFKPGYRYDIVVTSGVLDDAGISFDADSTARGRQSFQSGFRAEDSPTVRSHEPAQDATRVPVDAPLRLAFSGRMDLNSLRGPGLVLETGGIAVTGRALELSSDSTVLTIVPDAPLQFLRTYTLRADSTLRTTRGSRLDLDSLSAGYQPFLLRFTTKWESLPPQVVFSFPASGQQDVPLGVTCLIRFDHPILRASVDANTVYLEKLSGDTTRVPATVEAMADSLSATLSPSAVLLPSTRYRLNVSTLVMDRYGTRLDQDRTTADVRDPFQSEFTTAPLLRPLPGLKKAPESFDSP